MRATVLVCADPFLFGLSPAERHGPVPCVACRGAEVPNRQQASERHKFVQRPDYYVRGSSSEPRRYDTTVALQIQHSTRDLHLEHVSTVLMYGEM